VPPHPIPEPPEAVAAYYRDAPSPQRETMLVMRERILRALPGAQERIKYSMPTFTRDGVDVCGMLANKRHVGYYPYSGSVLAVLPDLVERYGGTKAALHVPVDAPLSLADVRRLVAARLAEAG